MTRLLPAGAAVLLAALVTGLGAAPAQAQLVVSGGQDYRSPQQFALEFRLGPYSPDVDGEFDGAKTPHRDYYGDGTRFLFQVEFDWQLYRAPAAGSIALGASAGYFYERARSPFNANDRPDAARSGDRSRFTLWPLGALAVYRADQLWQLWGIPLVPYGKVGLNYTIWSVYDGNDQVASAPDGGDGRGGTLGWQAAVGLSLVLDIVDAGSARELDSDTGINHTHLFIEGTKYQVSGLGQSNRLHVGDTTWAAGLMFEF